MSEKIIKVGYSPYLKKETVKKRKRTSILLKKIKKHKFISLCVGVVVVIGIVEMVEIGMFLNLS